MYTAENMDNTKICEENIDGSFMNAVSSYLFCFCFLSFSLGIFLRASFVELDFVKHRSPWFQVRNRISVLKKNSLTVIVLEISKWPVSLMCRFTFRKYVGCKTMKRNNLTRSAWRSALFVLRKKKRWISILFYLDPFQIPEMTNDVIHE